MSDKVSNTGNSQQGDVVTVVAESKGLGSLESALFKRGWNSGFGNESSSSWLESSSSWDGDDSAW